MKTLYSTYIKPVEAYQWFPGVDAPWTIEKSGDHYFVLHMGDNYDYGSYGPLTICPGDYIVKSKEIKAPGKIEEVFSWIDKDVFEKLYEIGM